MERRAAESGRAEKASESWSDSEAVAANAAGRLTPEQWRLVAGPRVRPPYGACLLLVLCAAYEWFLAWVVRDTCTPSDCPAGGATPVLYVIALNFVTQVVVFLVWGLISAISRWSERRRRRQRLDALAACRISSALGEVVEEPGAWPPRRAPVPAPPDAPPLPPPGWYRFYALEPATPRATPLLLSLEPVDREEAVHTAGHAEVPTDSCDG
ncbi:hypothetical protein ACQ86D_49925 [Streptomyces galilaeus]